MTESDITPPTVLLTGPTSGIGASMLAALTAHPARPRLVLLARDAAALERTVLSIRDRGLDAHGIRVDLGDLRSIRTALGELRHSIAEGTVAPIDGALLNAGAQFTSRRKASAQGYEMTFAINVIAQHLMVRELESLLSPTAHVVVLGSSTHRGKRASFNLVPDPQWDEPATLARPMPPATAGVRFAAEREHGGIAYATSKLALVTLSHDWAERLAPSGRRLNTYDPGLVPGTGLGKDMPGYMYWVWKNLMPAMSVLPGASTPSITARHAVALAMGDTFPTMNDGYVEIGKLTTAEAVTFDIERRRALWSWLESAVTETHPRGIQP
jgi:NAD(P)-dependent dehydrogenase (short-subunit alcohol dehydrogenase family)